MSAPISIDIEMGDQRLRFTVSEGVVNVIEAPEGCRTPDGDQLRLPATPGARFGIRFSLDVAPPSP